MTVIAVLLLTIYFAINIFIAGVYSTEDCDWVDNKFMSVVTVLFWSLFFCVIMAVSNIYKFVLHIWKRTWLCHYIQLRSEEKKYLGDVECELSVSRLRQLKEIVSKKKTLNSFKKRQIIIIDHQIELIKKNTLEKYGEIIE